MGRDQEPNVQVCDYGVAEMLHILYNDCKDLCEDVGSSGDPERKDPELVVRVSYHEAKEFAMGRMDVHMEVHILHIKSREPGSRGEKGDDQGEGDHPEINLQIKRLSAHGSKMG